MNRSPKIVPLLLAASLGMLSGCSLSNNAEGGNGPKGNGEGKPAAVSSEPVTLNMFLSMPIDDKDVKMLILDPVKQKYPNITIEVTKSSTGTSIDNLIAAGNIPDIIYTWNGALQQFGINDLLYDMTSLIKKNNFDLGRFEPIVLDAVKVVSGKGELYALPIAVNFNALYYNKDIFDRFGVSYPKDGMTWEDVIELANKVTAVDGSMQYRGFDPDNVNRMGNPLSLTFIDAKTNKATVDNESWKKVFQLAHQIWSIPGNKPDKLNVGGPTPFLKDRNVAMLAIANILNLGLEDATKQGLNWDMVQYPSYKDKPNTYGYVDTHLLTITSSSKHKDQALQVLGVVTSDEVQLQSVRQTARLSPLKNPEMKKQLGADMPFLKGKNIQSIFKSQPAPAPVISDLNIKARATVMTAFDEYFAGKDVNTALREANDKITKIVEAEKKK